MTDDEGGEMKEVGFTVAILPMIFAWIGLAALVFIAGWFGN